jgi:C1A family cysteine protease
MADYKEIILPSGTFKLNVNPSEPDKRDFVAEAIYPENASFPETLDLRPSLLPVRNQGSQGTCSAQVASCMKEYQEFRNQGLKGDDDKMSPQFIYNLREDIDEGGMTPRETMKLLQKDGICREAIYPYGSDDVPDNIPEDAYQDALNFKIENYAQINTIDGVKTALYTNGVCYICFPVYNQTAQMWKPAQGETNLGGHAMAIVGYNKQGFIIRNSWGSEWADSGYTIYPYEDWGSHYEIWTTIDTQSAWPIFDVSEYKIPIKSKHLLILGAAFLLVYVALSWKN